MNVHGLWRKCSKQYKHGFISKCNDAYHINTADDGKNGFIFPTGVLTKGSYYTLFVQSLHIFFSVNGPADYPTSLGIGNMKKLHIIESVSLWYNFAVHYERWICRSGIWAMSHWPFDIFACGPVSSSLGGTGVNCLARIRTTPQEDNSPPYRFWSWWVVLFRGRGPSGELSWWGIVLGIVVPVGNGWALFLSGGELSSWGVVLEPV